MIRCGECGRAMSVNYVPAKGWGYYGCIGRYNEGTVNQCSMSHTVRADRAEAQVWEFVYGILTDPARLMNGLEEMLKGGRQPGVGDDEATWLKKLSDMDRKRERLLDLHLEGDITTAQFRTKSADLEEARAAVENQIEAARSQLARLRHQAG